MPKNQPRIVEQGTWSGKSAEIAPEDRERYRLAILEAITERHDLAKAFVVARVREIAGADQRKVGPVVKDWREGRTPGLAHRWDGADSAPAAAPNHGVSPADEGESAAARLSLLARRAVTHDERDEVLRELAALAIEGALGLGGGIKPSDADKIRGLMGELRISDKDARTVPQDDPEKVYLLSEDGALLVSLFERIVADERRARALATLRELLEEDVRELPAVDPVGAL